MRTAWQSLCLDKVNATMCVVQNMVRRSTNYSVLWAVALVGVLGPTRNIHSLDRTASFSLSEALDRSHVPWELLNGWC